MKSMTVKELKDLIDREEYELTEGFPIGVSIGSLRCGGFIRDGNVIDFVNQLRFGLDRYDDDQVISHDLDGEKLVRSAVNIGKYRM